MELAEQLGENDVVVEALGIIGCSQPPEEGTDVLKRALARAHRRSPSDRCRQNVPGTGRPGGGPPPRHNVARRYLEEGISYCSDRGLDLFRLYLLRAQAQSELHQGHWDKAASTASAVLLIPRTSMPHRAYMHSLSWPSLRARPGDPGHRDLLEEAWELAEPTGELPRIAPVAAARAAVAWLEGDSSAVDEATAGALSVAIENETGLVIGELTLWRRPAGLPGGALPAAADGRYVHHLADEPDQAAQLWASIEARTRPLWLGQTATTRGA